MLVLRCLPKALVRETWARAVASLALEWALRENFRVDIRLAYLNVQNLELRVSG
jgi:hypothetical protein